MAEEILRCPRCGEVMLRQDMDFWKCPRCDGEFWPPEPEGVTYAHIMACWQEDVRRGVRKGGSRNGRKWRRRPIKPLPSERWILV